MIKNFVVNSSMNLINSLNKYDKVQLEEIKYGIESIYLAISKIIVIWCWISSSISFIGIPYICKMFIFPNLIYLILPIICLVCFILYAPADTVKRPLINSKKRKIYKLLSIISCVTYFIIIIFISNFLIKNLLLFALILESILILPITYKIFKLPYKTYLNY